MLKSRQHSVGACADMEIPCPPGIPKRLCLERSRTLRRLIAREHPAPPEVQSPPPMTEDTVGAPNPPVRTPTEDIFIESGPDKWSRGNDVRANSLTPFVWDADADNGILSDANRPVEVSDLMGGSGQAIAIQVWR